MTGQRHSWPRHVRVRLDSAGVEILDDDVIQGDRPASGAKNCWPRTASSPANSSPIVGRHRPLVERPVGHIAGTATARRVAGAMARPWGTSSCKAAARSAAASASRRRLVLARRADSASRQAARSATTACS